MNRPREIAEIEATLHCTFSTRELGPYVAFQSPLVPSGQADALNECHRLTPVVEQHCLHWNAMGYTVFLGYTDVDGFAVLAVPDADPLRLMNLFAVGSYNDVTGDTPERARRYMAELFATDPFVPYLVDAANFKVRFVQPVSAARADEIAHAIAEFDPDAWQLLGAPDLEDEYDVDPIDLVRQAIVNEQKLELWWD